MRRSPSSSTNKRAARNEPHFLVLGIILVVLALLKCADIYLYPVRYHGGTLDPVFRIPMLHLSLGMAGVEIILGAFMLSTMSTNMAAYSSTFLGTAFTLYRWLKTTFTDEGEPCGCLGVASSWSAALRYYQDNVLLTVAVFIFMIGIFALLKKTYISNRGSA